VAGVRNVLDKIDDLPSMPAAAARLVSQAMDDAVGSEELERLARTDEAISTAILRRANSATYGRPGRIFSLEESIRRLGRRLIVRIALEHQVGALLAAGGSAYGLRRGDLWRGALAGGLAAEAIAQELGDPAVPSDLAFLGGLLRDIGKLAIDASGFDASGMPQDEACFLEHERATVGADHAELGGALAGKWLLPERLANAIRFHHAPPPPDDPRHDPLFDVVHAADVVVLWIGLATGDDGLRYRLAPHVAESLLPSRRGAESLIAVTWSRLAEIEAELGTAA